MCLVKVNEMPIFALRFPNPWWLVLYVSAINYFVTFMAGSSIIFHIDFLALYYKS